MRSRRDLGIAALLALGTACVFAPALQAGFVLYDDPAYLTDNPIVRGLADFEADDELYAKLQGDSPITVLAEADSDWSKKTEPLAFTLESGKGRIFHEAFGHDGKAIHNPSVEKLIQRGCEWAATGKVE